jgi:dTMP kinase
MSRFSSRPHPGKLIAVEGIDGSGKSTQIYLLRKWLELEGYKVIFTEWNSSTIVKKATSKGKRKRLLTPTTFSLIHCTDFADRYERQILPLLKAGYIVLADRYIYTAFVRDAVRGCDRDWVRRLYSFASRPDLTFFFDVPLNVALDRILDGRPQLKYHEAGMDLGLSNDPYESFKIFQGMLNEEYHRIAEEYGFVLINAERQPDVQQQLVRKYVRERIDLSKHKTKGWSPFRRLPKKFMIQLHSVNQNNGRVFGREQGLSRVEPGLEPYTSAADDNVAEGEPLIVPPKQSRKEFPKVNPVLLKGKLIVLEGADGSGRSTQIDLLHSELEVLGYPVIDIGLKRSTLVADELQEALQGNTLSPITMSLFYATDFADQLENRIIPALRSGFIVLADRYIYTLMARDIVRGMSREWVRDIYSIALVPDAVFYLNVNPETLAERNLMKRGMLDFWESGMDIRRSGDMYECFIRYQRQLHQEFRRMQSEYGFEVINGNRSPLILNRELRGEIEQVLVRDSNGRSTAVNKSMNQQTSPTK